MAALGWGFAGFGLVLVWAGVKGEDLREVLADVFTGRRHFAGNAAPNAKPADPGPIAAAGAAAAASGAAAGATSATAPHGTVIRPTASTDRFGR